MFTNMNYFSILCFFVLISCVSLLIPPIPTLPPIRFKHIPKMVAFDLDFTLWPFWVDVDAIPPYQIDKVGDVIDVNGKQIKCYPESTKVIKYLHDNGIIVAIFTMSYDAPGSKQLLDIFGWKKYISYVHIHPGPLRETHINITNVEALGKDAKLDIKDILFIEDVYRNVVAFERLDLPSYLAHRGINMDVLNKALQKYSDFDERIIGDLS